MKTATVKEMIHRFRTAKPTPRAIRLAMQRNNDLPSKMFWEIEHCEDSPAKSEDIKKESKIVPVHTVPKEEKTGIEKRLKKVNFDASKSSSCEDSNKNEKMQNWRSRFRFGLEN